MKRSLFWIVTSASVSLAVAACISSSKQVCQEADWYELGRRQGAQGNPPEEVETVCKNSDLDSNRELYSNGYYKGLLEFCRPENGFELGKTGQKLKNICPPEVKDAFVKEFQAGQEFLQLEQANLQIDRKIDSIFEQLSKKNLDKMTLSQLESELSSLKKLRAQNARKRSQLESRQLN